MSEPDRMRCAVTAAESGAQWWDLATRTQRAQRREAIDHADLYRLAAEVVAMLQILEDLADVLAHQCEGYRERRDLRDDEDIDPRVRLATAARAAVATRTAVAKALGPANDFWSAISHVGRRYDPTTDPDPDHAREEDQQR